MIMNNDFIKVESRFNDVNALGFFPKNSDRTGMFVTLQSATHVFNNHLVADSLIRKLMLILKLEHEKTVANAIVVEKYADNKDAHSLVFVDKHDAGADLCWNPISQDRFNDLNMFV